MGFEHSTFRMHGERFYRLRHRRVFKTFWSQGYFKTAFLGLNIFFHGNTDFYTVCERKIEWIQVTGIFERRKFWNRTSKHKIVTICLIPYILQFYSKLTNQRTELWKIILTYNFYANVKFLKNLACPSLLFCYLTKMVFHSHTFQIYA